MSCGGGNKSISEDKDAYVLSRGNDGKGQLGFYKLSGETIEADKAYLEIPRIIPLPAAVTINK